VNIYLVVMTLLISYLSACVATPSSQQSVHLSEAAELNCQLGLAYIKQNNWAQAEDRLMLAKQQDPQSASVLNGLAYIFQKTQRIALARLYYEKALLLQPHNPELLNHFGAFLCQQGEYTQGTVLLNHARQYGNFSNIQLADENLKVCYLLWRSV